MFVSPTVVGRLVIVASCSGKVFAFDNATGEERWIYDSTLDGEPAQFHGDPLVLSNLLVVGSDSVAPGFLYGLDPRTGEARWKSQFAHGVGTTPLRYGRSVIVVTAEGNLVALDWSSGEVKWTVPGQSGGNTRFLVSPAILGDRVFFADPSGNLYGVSAASGKLLWRRPMPAAVNTSLAVAGSAVYVATVGGELYALEADSGSTRAKVTLAGRPFGSLVATPEALLILSKTDGASVIAYSPALDRRLWERQTATEWSSYQPLVRDGIVVVGSEQGDLFGFRLSNGEMEWSRQIEGMPRGLSATADTLFVGTLKGRLYALRY